MKSLSREILDPSKNWLVCILFLIVGFFLKGAVQTLGSSERLRRYKVQSNWAVRELYSRYHRLFSSTRRVTGYELLSVGGTIIVLLICQEDCVCQLIKVSYLILCSISVRDV